MNNPRLDDDVFTVDDNFKPHFETEVDPELWAEYIADSEEEESDSD